MSEIYSKLEPHQLRVVDEQIELETKITNLQLFINRSDTFKTLITEEQDDLVNQLAAMKVYNEILKRRIQRFIDNLK